MNKFILVALFVALAFGRENPFVPSKNLNQNTVATNIKERYEMLGSVPITPPNGAMLLREVVLRYQLDDGTQKDEVLNIDRAINQQASYFLGEQAEIIPPSVLNEQDQPKDEPALPEQSVQVASKDAVQTSQAPAKPSQPITAPAKPEPEIKGLEPVSVSIDPEQESVTIRALANDSAKNELDQPQDLEEVLIFGDLRPNSKVLESKNELDISPQQSLPKPQKPLQSLRVGNLVRVDVFENELKIHTKASLKRDFIYKDKKLILDFEASFREFKTLRQDLKAGGFSHIDIGSHSGFFRIVLPLSQPVEYVLEQFSGGYRLKI